MSSTICHRPVSRDHTTFGRRFELALSVCSQIPRVSQCCRAVFGLGLFTCGFLPHVQATPPGAIKIIDNLTFSGNFDVGYRRTQFFEDDHSATVGTWDVRFEYWVPFGEAKASYGPYVNLAGIQASENQVWENMWLALPAAGFQVYPFSFPSLRRASGWIGDVFGPLRIYGQAGRQKFKGAENSWRPTHQSRYGLEYWRATHVNDVEPWWCEFWAGWWRQASTEFSDSYNTWILAASVRSGLRVPDAGWLSALTPYALAETSSTRNTSYYWENSLKLGGGVRLAPRIHQAKTGYQWLNRFVVYAEYVRAEKYYHALPPPQIPDHDVRVGISFSLGAWYY